MIYDFDFVVDRRGSGSYKWDSAQHPDVIPLWVADMDFPTAPCVIEALHERVKHGIFGYTLVDDAYYERLTHWFASRHAYTFSREAVIYTSGVVPAISAIIKALAKPGSGVVVQTPVYNCFFSSIRNNGCRIVEAPLRRVDIDSKTFTYEMDFDALERATAPADVNLMLLCNPHNPAGRAWRPDELARVADICRHNGVTVVSDEIHCELTMPGHRYTPYATIDPSAIVCVSPSKAFNTAGLQIANIVTPDAETRAAIDRAININEVCDVNPFGVVALKASYTDEGAEWLRQLIEYLEANYRFLCQVIAERLPGCKVTMLEATYLPWIDIKPLGIKAAEIEHRLVEEASVWVNSGDMYGTEGYIRINVACPRSVLAEGLARMCNYLSPLLK